MFFEKYKIILGSQSPRRKTLLEGLGFKIEVRTKETNEIYPGNLSPEEIPVYLAQQKAASFDRTELLDNEILVTADTVVILENQILGKPGDEKEAKQMLSSLSGKPHHVITGVCLKSNQRQSCFSSITKVRFRYLSEDEISYYISHYKPFDKAGSYGIQEWIGYIGIESIEGSYSNVVGLPTEMLYQELKCFTVVDFNNL